MSVRLREQLEGAIQATVVGLVVVVALVASHIQPWNFPAFRPMRTFVLLELAALALAYLVVTRARLRLLPGLAVVAAFTLLALLSALWSPDPSLTVDRAAGFAVLMVAAAALALGAVDRPRVAGQLMLALLAATTLIALAGLFELWHAYDQAVLPATKGQGARYSGIGQNPNQIPMLIALVLPFALWAVRESRGRARVVVDGGGAAPRRLARGVRLARRRRRCVRRVPRLPAGCRPASAGADSRRGHGALRPRGRRDAATAAGRREPRPHTTRSAGRRSSGPTT